MTTWLAIVNPHAGSAKSRKKTSAVIQAIREQCPGEFKVAETEYSGHATALAKEATQAAYSALLSLGGDGTHNEVLNGLMKQDGQARNPDLALGVVNAGTGGDFVRFLYGKRPPEEIARSLASAKPKAVDIGQCTFQDFEGRLQSRLFLNIASFGLSGEVVHQMKNSSLRFGGQFSYLLNTIRALTQYRSSEIRISIDDGPKISRKVQTTAVANGQYFGGGMKIAPESDIQDGILDVIAVEDMPFLSTLIASPSLYTGAHLSHPRVHTSRAVKVEAETLNPEGPPIRVELDGEQPGFLPATFKVIPSALKLLTPSEGLP